MSRKLNYLLITTFIIILLFFYRHSLTNFFHADDFYNFTISKAETLSEFINFFGFKNTALPFYRPLPLQTFYFLSYQLFNLNPLPYHILSLIFLLGSIYLCYQIILNLTNKKTVALIALLIFTFSSHHLLRIAWITQIQETMVAFFTLATIYTFLQYLNNGQKNYLLFSILSFHFSLACKETAIVTPFILIYLHFLHNKNEKQETPVYWAIIFLIFFVYLYLRIGVMGTPQGEIYQPNLNPTSIVNNSFWYTLWSLNIAEMFVDFIGPGLSINPDLIRKFPFVTIFSLTSFITMIVIVIYKIWFRLKKIQNKHHLMLFAVFGYLLFLAPVLTFPWHKFAYSLSLPHFFLSLFLGLVLSSLNWKTITFLLTYFLMFITTNNYNLQHHWIFKRGRISKKVYQYFEKNYSQLNNQKILFVNSSVINKHWGGESKQVALAMFEQKGFDILFPGNNMQIFFEDIDQIDNKDGFFKIKADKFTN
jgi:hypothetical protein